tara:strand:- start:243 stop:581 length:339 start_codon:yes stop_codon:yes gene_type:complete
MQKHTKIYRDFWWDELTLAQTEHCRICDTWNGVDIHHIQGRGKYCVHCHGNQITNLICLCRKHHDLCRDKEFNKLVRVVNYEQVTEKLRSELDQEHLNSLDIPQFYKTNNIL